MLKSVPLTLALGSVLLSSCTILSGQNLRFDATKYTTVSAEVNGKTVKYRAYEGIVYVTNPEDTKLQSLNYYVPEEYFSDQSVGSFNAQTAPIFLPNDIGGYMPAEPGKPAMKTAPGSTTSSPNAALLALSKGYVVASPGARGRTSQNDKKEYIGKAPAAIVDLKAAVRYLRFNDAAMPGNSEKIVSNGTSAGGALSALLGATGNNPEFEPYLKAAGAAPARDDIFAVSAYCPITNLENADTAYEWQFNGVNDYQKLLISRDTNYQIQRTLVNGTLTADEIAVSDALKPMFPAYLNSLGLKNGEMALTLDASGNGPFKDYVASYVMASAQRALDAGTDLSKATYLTIQNGKVTGIDFAAYVKTQGRMKIPPAFDGLSLENGENELFGTRTTNARHFTAFSQARSKVSGSMAEAQVIRLMNPMNYIAAPATQPAKHWRIRHGTADKDTALAVPVILGTKLINLGYDVDLALPWNQGHGGDYDLPELFAWMDKVTK